MTNNFWRPGSALLAAVLSVAGTAQVFAAGEPDAAAAELAKNLANPLAAMISVPFQFNWDSNYGANQDGSKFLLNIQPVIPITLNAEWNLISRTILPVVSEDGVPPGTKESGVGDISESLFFSPVAPTKNGWIWGAGPVLLLPTATQDVLGAKKWGAGPTAVVLKQANGWTLGLLASHVWSFAGDADREDLSNSLLQPFLSYTTKTFTTFSMNTETTYDWKAKQWTVPINIHVAQLLKIGKLPIQFQVGARYWASSPEAGPHGWGGRFAVTLLLPK